MVNSSNRGGEMIGRPPLGHDVATPKRGTQRSRSRYAGAFAVALMAVGVALLAQCGDTSADSIREPRSKDAVADSPTLLFTNDQGIHIWSGGVIRTLVAGPAVAAFADRQGGLVAQLDVDGPLLRGVPNNDHLDTWAAPPPGSKWTLKGVATYRERPVVYAARRDALPERAASALAGRVQSELELGALDLTSGEWNPLLPLNARDGSILRSVGIGDETIARSTLERGARHLDVLSATNLTTLLGPLPCAPLPTPCAVVVSSDGAVAALANVDAGAPANKTGPEPNPPVRLFDLRSGQPLKDIAAIPGTLIATGRDWVVLQTITWERPGDGHVNLLLRHRSTDDQLITSWPVTTEPGRTPLTEVPPDVTIAGPWRQPGAEPR